MRREKIWNQDAICERIRKENKTEQKQKLKTKGALLFFFSGPLSQFPKTLLTMGHSFDCILTLFHCLNQVCMCVIVCVSVCGCLLRSETLNSTRTGVVDSYVLCPWVLGTEVRSPARAVQSLVHCTSSLLFSFTFLKHSPVSSSQLIRHSEFENQCYSTFSRIQIILLKISSSSLGNYSICSLGQINCFVVKQPRILYTTVCYYCSLQLTH